MSAKKPRRATRATKQPVTTAAPTAPALLVDENVAAAALGVSRGFLRKDRAGKRIIPFFKIGACVRYDLARVREALAAYEEGGAV